MSPAPLYFAYGSNLDAEQMKARCPTARPLRTARLADHRLGFTHYSKFSALVNAEEIVASPVNLQRLMRIAKRINFPSSRLFVSADR